MSGFTHDTFPAQFLLYMPSRSSTKDPFSGFILMNATKMPAEGGWQPYLRLTIAPPSSQMHEFDKNPFETLCFPGLSRWLLFRGEDSPPTEAPVHYSVRRWQIPVQIVGTGVQIPVVEIQKVNRLFVNMLKRNVLLRISAAGQAAAAGGAGAPATPIGSPPVLATPTTPSTSVIAHIPAGPAPPKPIKKKKPAATAVASHSPAGDLCLHVARQLLELAQLKKEMCPVIAEEYIAGEAAAMPCGHLFSKMAIQETFKKEPNKCPACRQAGRPTFV